VRGYVGIDRSTSACLHFVRNGEIRHSVLEIVEDLRRRSVHCTYVDYGQIAGSGKRLIDAVAEALQLAHIPYGDRPYLEFVDDMVAVADDYEGLVIVIDHADILLMQDQLEMFDLIEAFLVQFDRWYERGKPCHLCFQLEPNAEVSAAFGGSSSSRPIA
jgi:hypothetical protein